MPYANDCSEILDLFRAAGKPVPTEDSDMGQCVAILQKICDSQNHTIPDATEEQAAAIEDLQANSVEFLPGNAACNPCAYKSERGGYEFYYVADSMLEVVAKAAMASGIQLDIASDIFDALESLENYHGEDDFTLEFDGNEYRIIREDAIWDIYVEEIKQTVEDCYELNLEKIPDFIAISVDWEQTAKNAYADGYGHQFSGYDGSEEKAANHYIFRTN